MPDYINASDFWPHCGERVDDCGRDEEFEDADWFGDESWFDDDDWD